MDEITKLHKARITILEMMTDRNIEYPNSLNIEKIEQFRIEYYSRNIDIFINHEGQRIFIKFLLNSKIKPNQIKDIIEGLKTEHLEKETDKLILIIKPKPNSTILKIIKEKEYRFVEIFWLNNVVFNITKHVLVPKHIKITEEEIKSVMEKHYIVTKSIFPVMNRDDPIARYLNLSSGDVCKIIRKSPTSGEYISYRVVK
jgi:DNA-directed RNA polymerase I, II, and III subunit RPABC1